MTELLQCPFCGGEAEIHPSDDWDVNLTGATYFAWCDKCETRGDYYNTEAEAIKAWNTRAEPQKVAIANVTFTQEQIDEIKEYCLRNLSRYTPVEVVEE